MAYSVFCQEIRQSARYNLPDNILSDRITDHLVHTLITTSHSPSLVLQDTFQRSFPSLPGSRFDISIQLASKARTRHTLKLAPPTAPMLRAPAQSVNIPAQAGHAAVSATTDRVCVHQH